MVGDINEWNKEEQYRVGVANIGMDNENRNAVEVVIGGLVIKAIVDSGATVSIISSDVLKESGLGMQRSLEKFEIPSKEALPRITSM